MTGSTPAVLNTTLPCAACLRPLERVDGDPDVPYDANIFTTHGHYGSTTFDPVFGGERLELHICTPCMMTMRENAAIHRILQATEATAEQTFIWGSTEDPKDDNPWNKQRLRNEFVMEDFFEKTTGMTQARAKLIFDACQAASRDGKVFDPATISAQGEADEARIIAAAQATVDFYDDLRGHPSEWTEIEYAEAEAALKAADAHDAANGISRVRSDA
ncbi:hypothetical protein Achl_4370 (plasmid) [Pseudarthrobacter chlorophenolicus A6]|uniref:Uncharacterized protein n=1 Tax=Pseudarthrobacter chlorophenolicus (strain ATCC 700700 / DSM 12829 / CIP 107037 / JCM 12360 / KCTC 9906 / NCIMB 13794 / A6) TaxID=452863 RepID=B8HIS4_PSECP|nr:hypothetical protein [Pseudarthrobacter chlorophenolicus]ACL42321.1 hypothetical protein Achl_4370 [Pseudarthrobacter chlorophenolicus A6]SDQ16463.1 hypothetical protein SAMN04489738_0427 [Pseudarthrobacter chlorophenolicus]